MYQQMEAHSLGQPIVYPNFKLDFTSIFVYNNNKK